MNYFGSVDPAPLTVHTNSNAAATQLLTTEKPTDVKVRFSEHQTAPPRTGKRFKGTLLTEVRDHIWNRDNITFNKSK